MFQILLRKSSLTVNKSIGVRTFSTTPIKITMFTKEGCSLCIPVKGAIDFAVEEYDGLITYEEVDIEAPEFKETWWKQYRYDIPVIHLNDNEIARHRLEVEDLFDAIDEKLKTE